MNCSNCGAQLQPDDKFCTSCGTKVEEQKTQQSNQGRPTPRVAPPPPPPSANAYRSPSPPSPNSSPSPANTYTAPGGGGNPPPVGVLKFMLIQFLMVIPIVNLIAIFIISFKGGVNPSLRNYGRAMLIFMVIGIVLMYVSGAFEMIYNLYRGGGFYY
jgi:hypothetical protein